MVNHPKKGRRNAKPRKKRVSQTSFTRGMNNTYTVLHSQYTGYHSAVVERVMKTAVQDRKSQFLTHLSTALKAWFADVHNASEIEIQIAIHGQCMIISSNKNDTAATIYADFVRAEAGKFLESLKRAALNASKKALNSKAVEARRIERQSLKLGHELLGKRDVGLPLLTDLDKEGKDICLIFNASDNIGVSFAEFLDRAPSMAGKYVAFVTSTIDAHAEQKILMALCKAAPHLSDRSSSIVVSGTFRPCRGCYESLSVVKKYCFNNLQFGVRPGHFWRTTVKAHFEINKLLQDAGYISTTQRSQDFDEEGLLIGLTDISYRPVLRTRNTDDDDSSDEGEDALHFNSDSDSEYEP